MVLFLSLDIYVCVLLSSVVLVALPARVRDEFDVVRNASITVVSLPLFIRTCYSFI